MDFLGGELGKLTPFGEVLAAHTTGVFVEVRFPDGFVADLANALLAEGAADLL